MGLSDLQAIFPDADENHLVNVLARHGGDDHRAAEHLLANPPPPKTRIKTPTAPPASQGNNNNNNNNNAAAWAAGHHATTDNYFFGGSTAPVTALPYEGSGGGGGHAPYADGTTTSGVNAAAQRRISDLLPHLTKANIDAALRRHGGGLTSEEEEAALNFLLDGPTSTGTGTSTGGGDRRSGGGETASPGSAAPPSPSPSPSVGATATTTTRTNATNAHDRISATQYTLTPASASRRGPDPEPVMGTPVTAPHLSSPACAAAVTVTVTPAARPPPNLPPTRALSVNSPPPRLTGRKKALLIGINYVGTSAALKGCHNDVASLYELLTLKYGWPRDCVHALTDDGRRGEAGHPTRENIINAMRWLTQDAVPGDVLFFAFSGHGAQQEDPRGIEEDGMNETILPVDWRSAGMITDDEIGTLLVHTLPDGVRLTALMDSCHSGTGLDLPFTWHRGGGGAGGGGWREETNPYHSLGDVQMISGCEDDDVSCDSSRYGRSGGAMTTAFCEVLRVHPAPSYPVLLDEMRRLLRARGMPQRPQLSSSQRLHFDRPFLVDDVCSNTNPVIGRTFRCRFPPNPRRMDGSPLGGMLGVGAAVIGGMMMADVLTDVAASSEGAGAIGGMFDFF